MAHLQRSLVTLRICADNLVPDEITAWLGSEPTFVEAKGEERVGKSSGRVRFAKTGSWRLVAADREPEDIDGQVSELLSKLTADLAIWRKIREKCELDMFCGLFMNGINEGLGISPQTLAALGDRGIELALDIYAPWSDD